MCVIVYNTSCVHDKLLVVVEIETNTPFMQAY